MGKNITLMEGKYYLLPYDSIAAGKNIKWGMLGWEELLRLWEEYNVDKGEKGSNISV